jgi:hypothetical protein
MIQTFIRFVETSQFLVKLDKKFGHLHVDRRAFLRFLRVTGEYLPEKIFIKILREIGSTHFIYIVNFFMYNIPFD